MIYVEKNVGISITVDIQLENEGLSKIAVREWMWSSKGGLVLAPFHSKTAAAAGGSDVELHDTGCVTIRRDRVETRNKDLTEFSRLIS